MTSHDCVGAVRRLFGIKKVGHGGTLDPAAMGVLPVAIGRATRLLPYLAPDKSYEAIVRFGVTTSTDDSEGDILTRHPAPSLCLGDIEQMLPTFQGNIDQVPPVFSAIQVQGKRLYDLARQGKAVTPPARTVTIHQITVNDWQPGDFPEVTLSIDCGPGTYIRSIARDLGEKAGCGATLAKLVRTCSSGFCVKDSLTFAEIEHYLTDGKSPLKPVTDALAHLPTVELEAELARRWCLGQKITPPMSLKTDTVYRVLDEHHTFLGVGYLRKDEDRTILRAKMVFHQI